MKNSLGFHALSLAAMGTLFAACSYTGKDGDTCSIDAGYLVCSDNPANSVYLGVSTLVVVAHEPPGANCPAGGDAIYTGIDKNGDGILEGAPAPITDDATVSDVAVADSAHDTAVADTSQDAAHDSSVVDSAAADTAHTVTSGASEVTSVSYVCNPPLGQCTPGVDPFSGASWVVCGMISTTKGNRLWLSSVTNDPNDVNVDYICTMLGYSGADSMDFNCNIECNADAWDNLSCPAGTTSCATAPVVTSPVDGDFDPGGYDASFLVSGAHGRVVSGGGVSWTCK